MSLSKRDVEQRKTAILVMKKYIQDSINEKNNLIDIIDIKDYINHTVVMSIYEDMNSFLDDCIVELEFQNMNEEDMYTA